MAVGVDIGAGVGAFEGLRWISSEIVICDIGNVCKVKLIYYRCFNSELQHRWMEEIGSDGVN